MLTSFIELLVIRVTTDWHLGGRRGVVVTHLFQTAKLVYAGPG